VSNHDNLTRAAESYAVAFRVGLVGSIILTVLAVLGNTLATLLILVAWCLATLFLFPWMYLCYTDRELHIPPYLYRV